MDIALYSIRLVRPFSDEEVEKLLQFVPEERRRRLKNLSNPVLGHEPICAYFALLRGLNELYGWREIPRLVYNKYGKPEFADHPDVHFNTAATVLLLPVHIIPYSSKIVKQRLKIIIDSEKVR